MLFLKHKSNSENDNQKSKRNEIVNASEIDLHSVIFKQKKIDSKAR